MNSARRSQGALLDTLPMVFGILSATWGAVALAGWAIGQASLASFGNGLIPMAPSSAVIFMLIGTTLAVRSRMPQNRRVFAVSVFLALVAGAVGVLLLWSSFLHFYPTIEHLGLTITQPAGGTQLGHMSPATAASVVACAATILLIVKPSTGRSKRAVLALVLSSLLILASMLFLVGYLYASPLMYGGEFIPMALPTALAVVSLALGLHLTAGSQVWPASDTENAAASQGAYALLLLFLFFASAILTGGYFTYRSFERNFRVEVERQLSAIASMKVEGLMDLRHDWLGEASLLSQNAAFSGLVSRAFGSPGNAEARASLQSWLRRYQKELHYDLVCVLDARGVVRMSHTAEGDWTDDVLVERAREALQSNGPSIVDFYRDEHDQRVYVAVLVPIKSDRVPGRSLGVVALRIDPQAHLYPLVRTWPMPAKTSESLILRREGDYAVFLNDLRFQDSVALNFRIHISNDRVAAVKAALGIVGVFECLDYRGHEVIADVGPVPGSPWFYVVRTDRAEVYEPFRERLWLLVVIVGVLLLGVGAGIMIVWRNQRSRYFQEQLGLVQALALSEAQYRASITNSLDAILLTSPDGSIFAANPAACTMFQRSEEELVLVGRSAVVDMTDPRLAALLSERASNGSAKGVLTLQRKDGTRFTGELSSSSFLDREGRNCTSMFIRDVSERERSAEALLASQRLLEGILDVVPVRIFWKDKDLVYLGCNAAFARDAGFTDPKDVIGKDDFQMGWRDQAELYRGDDRQVIESGSSRLLLEEPQTTPGGKTITLLTSKVPFRNSAGDVIGVVGTYMDITERKQAEIAIKENETRYRTLFETANDAIFIMNTEVFLDCNLKTEVMFGCRKEDLVGRPPSAFSPALQPNGRMSSKAAREKMDAAQSGVPQFFEWQHVRIDGTPFDAEVSLNKFEIDGALYIQAIVRDITARKRGERQVRDTEKRFKAIFDQAPIAMALLDLEGHPIISNLPLSEMVGYSNEELRRMKFQDFTHPEDVDKDLVLFAQLTEGKIAKYTMEKRYVHKNGDLVWGKLHVTVLRDENGIPRDIIGMVQDITNRKLAEDALSKSEERFRALAENSSDIISVIGMDGMIRYESPSVERLLGYKPEEWVGTSAFDWMHPDDRARVAELLSQAIQKPVGGASAEFRLRHVDGSWRMFEAVGRSYLDEDGQRAGLINSRDITERKRAEAQVNEQIVELQRWHDATIGRETRILGLKREVNELLGTANQPPRYASVDTTLSDHEG